MGFQWDQQSYSLAEKDSGFTIRELISIANGEVEAREPDVEVMSDSRSSVPTTPECDVIVISDSETDDFEKNVVDSEPDMVIDDRESEIVRIEMNSDIMRRVHEYNE